MSGVPFSLVRVALIAGNTLREAARQRVLLVLGLVAFALVVAAQWLRELNFGASELKFLADFGFGALAFFGAVLAIVATAQLFFAEIEHRTVQTLLAKPVRRSEFVLGKFAGVVVVLSVYAGLMTLVIALVLHLREAALLRQYPEALARGGALDLAAVVAAGAGQWLKLVLVAALTLLVASFARTQLFASMTGFWLLVIGHLQGVAHRAAAQGDSVAMRIFTRALAWGLPRFDAFDLSDTVLGGGAWVARLGWLGAYAAGYALVVLALAVVIFRKREI